MAKDDKPTLVISAKDEPTRENVETKLEKEPTKSKSASSSQTIARVLLPIALLGSAILTAQSIHEAQLAQQSEIGTGIYRQAQINDFEESPEFRVIAQSEVLEASYDFTNQIESTDNIFADTPNTDGINNAINKIMSENYAEEVLRNESGDSRVPEGKTQAFKLAENAHTEAKQASKEADAVAGVSATTTGLLGVVSYLLGKKNKKKTASTTAKKSSSTPPKKPEDVLEK